MLIQVRTQNSVMILNDMDRILKEAVVAYFKMKAVGVALLL